jgi:hypothetical protein
MQAAFICSKDVFFPDIWDACDALKDLLQRVAEVLHVDTTQPGAKVSRLKA